MGFDVHPFSDDPSRVMVLGGVRFEGPGLAGHSDADVISHAVADALLGAAGLGDIGMHFSDTDPRWAGADSLRLLRTVAETLRAEGWEVGNVDATVIAQRPRLAEHIPTMRANLARALGVPPADVSVKATTTDRLGALGEGLGIAAQAVALLIRRL